MSGRRFMKAYNRTESNAVIGEFWLAKYCESPDGIFTSGQCSLLRRINPEWPGDGHDCHLLVLVAETMPPGGTGSAVWVREAPPMYAKDEAKP